MKLLDQLSDCDRYPMNDKNSASNPIEAGGQVAVGRFFDLLTDDYTAVIERCFPRYREMLWALLEYLPSEARPHNILELGCGTGNLSVLLASRYEDATLRMTDISSDSLQTCEQRFSPTPQLIFQQSDFRELDFADAQFDLIVSSIAIHHLTSEEKRVMFGKISRWLTADGVFAYADQHAGATDDLNGKHIENWKTLSHSAGSTPQEWEMWMQHQQQHDHHDSLFDQIDWLRGAGFAMIDCPWRYLLWAVLICQK
jgi:tRNA (cmo5U34)-methyltransferase